MLRNHYVTHLCKALRGLHDGGNSVKFMSYKRSRGFLICTVTYGRRTAATGETRIQTADRFDPITRQI